MSKNPDKNLTEAEFNKIQSHADLLKVLKEKDSNISSVLSKIHYEKEKEIEDILNILKNFNTIGEINNQFG